MRGHGDSGSGPLDPTRRTFLLTTGSAAAATAFAESASALASGGAHSLGRDMSDISGLLPPTVHINGKERKLRIDPRTTLLDCLRETLALQVGARGIGEIGLAGIAAAITDAVHHATGVRVRELPVKTEDLLVVTDN
jgi:hypothetical protein